MLTVKAICLGEPRVGKTSFISQCCLNRLDDGYTPTTGMVCTSKEFKVPYKKNKILRITLWDVPGETELENLSSNFHNIGVFFYFFTLVDPKTLEYLLKIDSEVDKLAPKSALKILVGNKVDKFSPNQGQKFVMPQAFEVQKMPYFEVSSKTKEGFDQLFDYIVDFIENQFEKNETKKNHDGSAGIKFIQTFLGKSLGKKQRKRIQANQQKREPTCCTVI